MMSDVLAFVKDQAVLLTGLCNPQVVRTAEMMDMRCIVFVRGKNPPAEDLPEEERPDQIGEYVDVYMGRTYMDAPGVDGYIFVATEHGLMSGDMAKVRVTGASEYDLYGEIL